MMHSRLPRARILAGVMVVLRNRVFNLLGEMKFWCFLFLKKPKKF